MSRRKYFPKHDQRDLNRYDLHHNINFALVLGHGWALQPNYRLNGNGPSCKIVSASLKKYKNENDIRFGALLNAPGRNQLSMLNFKISFCIILTKCLFVSTKTLISVGDLVKLCFYLVVSGLLENSKNCDIAHWTNHVKKVKIAYHSMSWILWQKLKTM